MNYIYCRFHSLLSKRTFYEMILIWFEKSSLGRFIKLQSTSQCNWRFYCPHLYFCWIIKHYCSEIGNDMQNLSWSDLKGWSCQREKRNFYLHGLVFFLKHWCYVVLVIWIIYEESCILESIFAGNEELKLFLTKQNKGCKDDKCIELPNGIKKSVFSC